MAPAHDVVEQLARAVESGDEAGAGEALRQIPGLCDWPNQSLPADAADNLVALAWGILSNADVVDPLHVAAAAALALEALLNRRPAADVVVAAALELPLAAARKVALIQLARLPAADMPAGLGIVPSDVDKVPALFSAILRAVADSDVGVGMAAVQVLTSLTTTTSGRAALLAPSVIAEIHAACKSNEVALARLSDVYLHCASASEEALTQVSASTALEPLFIQLNSSDPLVRLAAVAMIREHVRTAAGVQLLDGRDVLTGLASVLRELDGLDGQVLGPEILSFFAGLATIANVDWPTLQAAHGIFTCIENTVLGKNGASEPVLLACLDAIATVAGTPNGLIVLMETASPDLWRAVCTLATSTSGGAMRGTQVAATHMLARCLDLGTGNTTPSVAAADTARRFFECVDGGTSGGLLQWAFGRARLPFDDVSNAAYFLLQSIASYDWGASVLLAIPNFYAFVLDRLNTNRATREWKYAIVQRLGRPSVELTVARRTEVTEWLAQGPHYYRGTTGDIGGEVASLAQ